jgi:hypothetical protein
VRRVRGGPSGERSARGGGPDEDDEPFAVPRMLRRMALPEWPSARAGLRIESGPSHQRIFEAPMTQHERFERDAANRWLRELVVELYAE